jgi:hypothetical protein
MVSSKFPLYVIHRETAAAPSFDTAEPIECTARLESPASEMITVKRVMQFLREFPLIVTGLTQIAAIKAMVDFALPGLTLERISHYIRHNFPILV